MAQLLKIDKTMKIFTSLILSVCFFINSCAQQKFEKPPKPGKGRNYKIKKGVPSSKIKKGHLVLNLGRLEQNKDSLYCWETEGNCDVIDAMTTIYTTCDASDGDNASVIDCLYAEGEFLEGKYHGVWKYYDKNGKVIKKEKWDNGKLIYRKEYNFNTCDNLENYKISNINLSGYHSIEQFKKDFLLKSGKLACKNGVIKNMRLVFQDETTIQFIRINKGLVRGHEIQIINDPIPSEKSYYYDKEGNVKAIFEVKNELLKGSGHYIDYYYPKNIKSNGIITTPILKSEGEIKNNFKFGEWKYYNKDGSIDSVKTYSLKDAVDVRFPYCIFNKNEPCY